MRSPPSAMGSIVAAPRLESQGKPGLSSQFMLGCWQMQDARFFQSTRGRIVAALRRRHSASAVDLASEFGLSANAVRQQLVCLERDGFVEERPVKRGPTKPTLEYSLTADADTLFPAALRPAVERRLARGARDRRRGRRPVDLRRHGPQDCREVRSADGGAGHHPGSRPRTRRDPARERRRRRRRRDRGRRLRAARAQLSVRADRRGASRDLRRHPYRARRNRRAWSRAGRVARNRRPRLPVRDSSRRTGSADS